MARIIWMTLLLVLHAVYLKGQQVEVKWDRTLGGAGSDKLHAAIATSDGGFLLGGFSNSEAGFDKTENNRGSYPSFDFWIVKIDSLGNKLWDKTYGGTQRDFLNYLLATPDGGFLLAGTSESPGGGDRSEPNIGDLNYWLIKTNSNGNKVWDKTFGSIGIDRLDKITATPDGGFLIAAHSYPSVRVYSGHPWPEVEEDQPESKNTYGNFLIRMDANGNMLWKKIMEFINKYSLTTTSLFPTDAVGNYVVGGYIYSPSQEDTSGVWTIKIEGLD
jgi:hypothetical protein